MTWLPQPSEKVTKPIGPIDVAKLLLWEEKSKRESMWTKPFKHWRFHMVFKLV